VPEGISVDADREQHVAADGGADGTVKVTRRQSGDAGQQLVGHAATGHRRCAKCLPAVLVERVEPQQQEIGKVVGE